MCRPEPLTRQSTQKFLLIHPVLEGFAPVDEDDRHLVVELATEFAVAIHIDFMPDESSATREFVQTLFDHLAKMAALARIHYDLSGLRHIRIVTFAPLLKASKNKLEPFTRVRRALIKPLSSRIPKCLSRLRSPCVEKPA